MKYNKFVIHLLVFISLKNFNERILNASVVSFVHAPFSNKEIKVKFMMTRELDENSCTAYFCESLVQ